MAHGSAKWSPRTSRNGIGQMLIAFTSLYGIYLSLYISSTPIDIDDTIILPGIRFTERESERDLYNRNIYINICITMCMYIYINLSLSLCGCVLCSGSVVETKNHARMQCLKIGHPKILWLTIVSEYSKWRGIGERTLQFCTPISPLYPIFPFNPYRCWLFLVASRSHIHIVKCCSYMQLLLVIHPHDIPHISTYPHSYVDYDCEHPHVIKVWTWLLMLLHTQWLLNPPLLSQFGSPRVLRRLSWTRHSVAASGYLYDMGNVDSSIDVLCKGINMDTYTHVCVYDFEYEQVMHK